MGKIRGGGRIQRWRTKNRRKQKWWSSAGWLRTTCGVRRRSRLWSTTSSRSRLRWITSTSRCTTRLTSFISLLRTTSKRNSRNGNLSRHGRSTRRSIKRNSFTDKTIRRSSLTYSTRLVDDDGLEVASVCGDFECLGGDDYVACAFDEGYSCEKKDVLSEVEEKLGCERAYLLGIGKSSVSVAVAAATKVVLPFESTPPALITILGSSSPKGTKTEFWARAASRSFVS